MKSRHLTAAVLLTVLLCQLSSSLNGQWTESVSSYEDSYVPLSRYKLYFNDEFNGPSLNTSKWYTRYIYNNGKLDYLNDELERYRDNNNHVFNNGILSLVARKMVNSTLYESGMIRSRMETIYGYFEARVRMPSAKGVWPAFWLNSGYSPAGRLSWPPEIDIFEFVINGKEDNPGPVLNMVSSSVVTRATTPSYYSYVDKSFSTNIHTYYAPNDLTKYFTTFGMEWTERNVTLFVNGTHVYTRNYTWVYPDTMQLAGPAHVLLNFAVGGSSWAGRYGVNETAFPQAFEVDWMRVFKPIDVSNNGTVVNNSTNISNGTISYGNSSTNGNRAFNSSSVQSTASRFAINLRLLLILIIQIIVLLY